MTWQTGEAFNVAINGNRLEMRCWGPPPKTGYTIVLLHEGLGCVAMWKGFPQALAKSTGCSVLAFSRLGYGGSDAVALPRPVDYMTDEALGDLPAVLDQFDLQKVILVGHSDGASIAAVQGGMAARRVRGLCLMAPHFFTEEESIEQITKARQAYDHGDLKARLQKFHPNTDNTFNGWCDGWLTPEFLLWNIEDFIDTIRVPVLAIQGAQDEYATLAHIEALQTRLYAPLDVKIIDECRHSPHLDKPKETTDAIANFVHRLIRIEQSSVVTK